MLALIREGKASSRPAIEHVSGLSRVTVAQRLRYLFDAGLVVEGDVTEASGGRPARVIRANPDFAIALAADVGESAIRVAATDLTPRIVAETTIDLDVASGPQTTLTEIVRAARKLAGDLGKSGRRVLASASVFLRRSTTLPDGWSGPSVMRGWDEFDIAAFSAENSAFVRSSTTTSISWRWPEFRQFWPRVDHFLFIKAEPGIGSGIILNGAIYRGARGASGDIGHMSNSTR